MIPLSSARRVLSPAAVTRAARVMSTPAAATATATTTGGSMQKLDPNLYITQLNARRQPSAIRALQPLIALPGMISLGGGLPNPALFPFKGLALTLDDGAKLDFAPNELATALQYSPTPGIPSFLAQLKELMVREHQPLMDPSTWTVSVATGSSDALYRAFDMLVEAGDNVLIEAPTYSGSLAALRPLQPNFLEIEVDEYGLIPSKLESMLNTFHDVGGRAKPRVLYIIPTGQNPGGATLTTERKKEIYKIACRHDLIILEDDPYNFLSYGSAPAPPVGRDADFTRPVAPSFFSLDTEGRVLRFDSFSKVLSSGLRLGTVTGPKAFVERMDLVSQAAALHTSGVSQMMVSKLLTHWGASGWSEHVRKVSLFYARRRDVFLAAVERHLSGLVDYTVPTAGMFVYFHLRGVADAKRLIETKARDARVLLVPGQSFSPKDQPSNGVRASFSTATDEEIDIALSRLATLLKNEAAESSAAGAASTANPQSKL